MAGRTAAGRAEVVARRFIFALRFGNAAVRQEGVSNHRHISNHRHKSVTMKTVPGSSLEVIETEFLFQLLMRSLADQSGLDGCCQPPQAYLGW